MKKLVREEPGVTNSKKMKLAKIPGGPLETARMKVPVGIGLDPIKTERKTEMAKGYFLITAFILFIIGAILDSVLEIEDVSALLIPRFILIAGGLIFYLGFITPNFIKKRLK